jgi:ankyrin repeat protein
MSVGGHFATSRNHGYPLMMEAIRALNASTGQPYSFLSATLTDNDLEVKHSAFKFLASLLGNTDDPKALSADLNKANINHAIKNQINERLHPSILSEIIKIQHVRLNALNQERHVSFNATNKEHEDMLRELWSLGLPNMPFERVSKAWGLLGFQGQDPITDLRGMGIAGLRHFLYFARNYTAQLRQIIAAQKRKAEVQVGGDYPIAVAGINISNFLLSTLKADANPTDENLEEAVVPLLFDHEFAFEEVYTQALLFLDKLWENMQATYMDFPRVMVIVKEKATEALGTSKSIKEFRAELDAYNAETNAKKDKKKGIGKLKKKDKKKAKEQQQPVENYTATLRRAWEEGDIKLVSQLIADGHVNVNFVDPLDVSGGTLLHRAVAEANEELVRLLAWKNANVNAVDGSGWTPLHLATKSGLMNVVKALLEQGADWTLMTKNGVLPIHYAASANFKEDEIEVVRLLEILSRDLPAEPVTHSSETPLMYAVSPPSSFPSEPFKIKWFIAHGANIEHRNSRGNNALQNSIMQGRAEAVAALLEAGADLNSISGEQATCYDLAKNNQTILRMLADPANASKYDDKPIERQQATIQKATLRRAKESTVMWEYILDRVTLSTEIAKGLSADSILANCPSWVGALERLDGLKATIAADSAVLKELEVLAPTKPNEANKQTLARSTSAGRSLIAGLEPAGVGRSTQSFFIPPRSGLPVTPANQNHSQPSPDARSPPQSHSNLPPPPALPSLPQAHAQGQSQGQGGYSHLPTKGFQPAEPEPASRAISPPALTRGFKKQMLPTDLAAELMTRTSLGKALPPLPQSRPAQPLAQPPPHAQAPPPQPPSSPQPHAQPESSGQGQAGPMPPAARKLPAPKKTPPS